MYIWSHLAQKKHLFLRFWVDADLMEVRQTIYEPVVLTAAKFLDYLCITAENREHNDACD